MFLDLHRIVLAAALAALAIQPSSAQVTEFDDGTTATPRYHRAWRPGPPPPEAEIEATGLTFFTGGFSSFGKTLPITFLGTNPSVPGAGTTTIPAVIVPLRVNFLDGSGVMDAAGIVDNTLQSPVFSSYPYVRGGVNIGTTQYGDAVQRAEFWSFVRPSGVSPDYHVLLGGPDVRPAVTINIPANRGHISVTSGGIPFGRVDDSFWEPALVALLTTIGATADQMPIFLAKDIGLYSGAVSNCCALGYHNSTSGAAASAQTWIFASWLTHGLFSGGFEDLVGLSHEVSEWINDPFVGAATFNQVPGVNWVAPYILPGQGGACQPNFETGDAVEALAAGTFTIVGSNGFTYHLQDSVFVWWFLHTIPSPAVNGSYTLQNIFSTVAGLCGPG